METASLSEVTPSANDIKGDEGNLASVFVAESLWQVKFLFRKDLVIGNNTLMWSDSTTWTNGIFYFYIFSSIFQKYLSHLKFCKIIQLPPYDTTFRAKRRITWWL
jgi:hypothetical protein